MPCCSRQRLDCRQCLSEAGTRHDAVLDDEVGTEPAHGRERRLPALPDPCAVLIVFGHARLSGARVGENLPQLLEFAGDLRALALELHEQQRRGVRGIIRLHRGLSGVDGEAIHDFHRSRQQPGPDHARHGVAGGLKARVRRQHRAIHLRARDQPQRDLQRDPEQPFGSDEQAGQIRSRLFKAVAAQRDERPVGQDRADAEHVVRGHAMTETVRAARVEGHVAANRADLLAGRIGRVVEAMRRAKRGDREIDDAGLDHGHARARVEPHDPIQPVERDDNSIFDRHGAARQAGAAATGHERHTGRLAQADGLDHVLRRFGDDDGPRPRAERREAVRLVGGECARSRQKAIGWHQPGEIVKKRCVGHGGSEDTATVALWRVLCPCGDP